MLTTNEIAEIVQRIVTRLRPEKVILFGSYAKGMVTPRSDLDLFVIQETILPFTRRANSVTPLLTTASVRVDLHIYTPEEVESYRQQPFSFVSNVLASGQIMYTRDGAGPVHWSDK
ncbi:MAG TPA: nucleotidyltransferase domain-containing protein [Ktedonosporobacter sp.]|jgi:predicted nucleotidyltransferase|nr:nucleotidyltransferase domain-containing protein [Ktedonosporobacter sp.]